MDKHASLLDSLWCLIFSMTSLTSMGVLIWIYWNIAVAAQ
jgi:hypothetical protein